MADPTSVYLYHDQRWVLLYVGITKQGPGRQNQHNSGAPWWRYVAHQDVEHYDTRDEAKSRESWLIRERRPPFNRQENPQWPELRRSYLMLFDPDVLKLERAVDAPRPCGHCYECRYGDGDSPCSLAHPAGNGEEDECEICGRARCLHALGVEEGKIRGAQEMWGWLDATRGFLDEARRLDSGRSSDLSSELQDAGHALLARLRRFDDGKPAFVQVKAVLEALCDGPGRGAYAQVDSTPYAHHLASWDQGL